MHSNPDKATSQAGDEYRNQELVAQFHTSSAARALL